MEVKVKTRKLFAIAGSVCLMLVIAALPFMAACAAPEPTPVPTPTPTPTPVVPAPAPAPEKVIEIKWSTYYPVLHPMNYDCYGIWLKELDERTNGRTSSIMFGGGSMATPKENYNAVNTGMADMGDVWCPPNPGVFPLAEMWHLPYMAPTAAISAQSIYRYTTTHEEALNEFEKNFHFVAQHSSAIQNLHTTADAGLVKTLEELKGMLLGTDNPKTVGWFCDMGAACTRIDTHDAYLALEKGVIQGGVWPWAPLRSQKITEFAVNHTIIDLMFVVSNVLMNKEKWESFPQDIKAIINEIGGADLSAFAGYTLTNGSLTDVKYMKDKGDQFYTLPPDEKARWSVYTEAAVQEWIDEVTAKGLTTRAEQLYKDAHTIVAEVTGNPMPEMEWWGPDAVGRYGSPNRPGGWK